jgi:hypothetical protein
MNGRRREQFKGIYPGPYRARERTKSDIAVTAEGPEGPVVVGRFYATKSIDAEAQARAYAALPDLLNALRAVHLAMHPDVRLREQVWDALEKAGL